MRVAVVSFLFLALSIEHLSASHPKLTDAELDGMKGAVKSVSTAIEQVERHTDTSDHPVLIYPVWCRVDRKSVV